MKRRESVKRRTLLPAAVPVLLALAALLLFSGRGRAGTPGENGGTWGEAVRGRSLTLRREQIAGTRVGLFFTLGAYEQDGDPENGPEPIQWKVLAKDGDRVLAVSRYILDCRRYDEERREVTWETCTLRAWLNGEFLDSAFRPEELGLIPLSRVPADPNPQFSTDPGADTEDRLFLLSIREVEEYLPTDERRICRPTDYAKARGADPNAETGAASWWVRTPGAYYNTCAARISSFGYIDYIGSLVNCGNTEVHHSVRPALWIDLGEKEVIDQ